MNVSVLADDKLATVFNREGIGSQLADFEGHRGSTDSFMVAGCLGIVGGVTYKILVEPTCSTHAQEVVLAHLRYGVPWRYMTPTSALHIDDDGSSDSDTDVQPAPPLRVGFRIIVPGFATEKVEVSIVPPTTIAEVLPQVQAARCQLQARNFPRLVPASPQPLVGDGVFLACPVWSVEVATSRRQVCIDCSELDGRVYAALLPPYLTGASIPGLANLPQNLAYARIRRPFW